MGSPPVRGARQAVGRVLLERVVAVFAVILAMDLLLFIPAGRLDWPAAWSLSLVYGVFLLAYAVWGTLKAPDLLGERSQVAENVKIWDRAIMAIYTVLLLTTLVLAGLDVGRAQRSQMPAALQVLGLVGTVLAGGLIFWTILTNAYLGRMVRIQEDRGHQVVTGGEIIATKSIHQVDTEGAASTDNLDTITGGVEGDLLVLRASNSTRTIVAKDGTGNLRLAGDFTMDHKEDSLFLIHDGDNWIEVSRSNNS